MKKNQDKLNRVCDKKKTYLMIFLFSFIFSFILTYKIPFYHQDYLNLFLGHSKWSYDLLAQGGQEFYFRPLENMIHIIFFKLFGIDALPFRILKALAGACVSCIIFYYVRKYGKDANLAILSSVFYITNIAVLQSIFLIFDFEIIVQILLLIIICLFLYMVKQEKFLWKETMFIMVLFYIAVLIKDSVKIVPIIFLIYIMITDWKRLRYLIIVILSISFITVFPGWLLGLHGKTGSMITTLITWFDIDNLVTYMKYLIISCWSILILLLITLALILKNKKRMSQFYSGEVIFLLLWFTITSTATVLAPMTDIRYSAAPLLPFIILSFTILGIAFSVFKKRKVLLTIFLMLIVLNIIINAGYCVKHSYSFGNAIIALDKSYSFNEQNYKNTNINYQLFDAYVYKSVPSYNSNKYTAIPNERYILNHSYLNKTDYLAYYSNEMPEKPAIKGLSLEKTFVEGPNCLMLYRLHEKETDNASIKKSDMHDNAQKIVIADKSSCTARISTRFFFPETIKIKVIGNRKNYSVAYVPPIGKSRSCEYLCPKINNDTIRYVEVSTNNNFLNKIIKIEILIRNDD